MTELDHALQFEQDRLKHPIVWVDIETTGLSPRNDLILELGVRVTDEKGKVCWEATSPVWNADWQSVLTANPYAFNMHTDNGLVGELTNNDPPRLRDFEAEVLEGLFSIDIPQGVALAGSSVHFDRAFLEVHCGVLMHHFGYRNIDVSGIREVTARVSPEKHAAMPDFPAPEGRGHRVDSCLDSTIALYRWQLEAVFGIHVDCMYEPGQCRDTQCARCFRFCGSYQGHYWAHHWMGGKETEFHICCPPPMGCELDAGK